MSLLTDPGMQEIVVDFCEESLLIVDELEEILDTLEEDPADKSLLESYGQKIDRIMGAASTIGAHDIAKYCEIGKVIGYKTSQAKDPHLIEFTIAMLFDLTDLVRKMLDAIRLEDDTELKQINTDTFFDRLKWVSEKLKTIQKGNLNGGISEGESEVVANEDIDNLIDELKKKNP